MIDVGGEAALGYPNINTAQIRDATGYLSDGHPSALEIEIHMIGLRILGQQMRTQA